VYGYEACSLYLYCTYIIYIYMYIPITYSYITYYSDTDTMGPGPGLVARVLWLYCMRLASSGVGCVHRVPSVA